MSYLWILIFAFACESKKDGSPPSADSRNINKQLTLKPAEEKKPEKVDATTLQLSNITLTELSDENKDGLVISFAPSSYTTLVEVVVCPYDDAGKGNACDPSVKDCVLGQSCSTLSSNYTRVRLPRLYKGRFIVTLKPCASYELVKNPDYVCGKKVTKIYNSNFYSPEIDSLLQQLDIDRKIFIKLHTDDQREIMQEFITKSELCTNTNAKSYQQMLLHVALIKQVIRLPAQWFVGAANDTIDATPGGQAAANMAGKGMSEVWDLMGKIKNQLCNVIGATTTESGGEKACMVIDVAKTFLLGMAMMMSPTAAVEEVSMNIQTLVLWARGKKSLLAMLPCTAEETYSRKMEALIQTMETQLQKIMSLKDRLAQMDLDTPVNAEPVDHSEK
jgi:hypothetical protein